jgi:hypothetical protein
MVDHERGAYTPPTEGPLAFESRQPVRGARPFPLTLVISVLVLLGLAAAIFLFYRSGVRQAAAPPQDVGQPVGPLKTPAPPEAQPQDPAQGLEIYRSETGQPPQLVPAQPQFTPPPEQPQPRPDAASQAAAAPPPAATAPALRPAQPAPSPVAAAPAAAPAKAEAPPKPTPKPPAEKAPEKPAPAAKAGTAAVQIGAVSSTQLADQVWNQAVAVAPGMGAGKGKGVEKVESGGKVLYRTLVTGFASRADAQAFCAKLKAAGKACFVK